MEMFIAVVALVWVVVLFKSYHAIKGARAWIKNNDARLLVVAPDGAVTQVDRHIADGKHCVVDVVMADGYHYIFKTLDDEWNRLNVFQKNLVALCMAMEVGKCQSKKVVKVYEVRPAVAF